MRIVLAPDSFKESLTARAAALAMERGVKEAIPGVETVVLPIADGGEGTMDALVLATGGTTRALEVTGPLGRPVRARCGLLGDGSTAVVEMAEASGLPLVPLEERDPLRTTSRGTGELIRHALDTGARRVIVAIGGSATNDAGAGALQALGAGLFENAGPLAAGGAALERLDRIDLRSLDPRLSTVELRVACDVTNPLCGPRGASAAFGPQKGASPADVARLDAALRRFAQVLKRDAGLDVLEVQGAGAAGGLGAGLLACGAVLTPGIDLVLDAVGFEARVAGATVVFTGEGRIDGQTPGGKAVAGIVARAARAGVPVIAFAGEIVPGFEALLAQGLLSVHPIVPRPCSRAEALADGEANLQAAARAVARVVARWR